MDKQTAIELLDNLLGMVEDNHGSDYDKAIHMGIDALKTQLSEEDATKGTTFDCISRQAAIAHAVPLNLFGREVMMVSVSELENLPSVQQETEKYEYHYDHTDCIWYRPEARNRCPVTCAQYRDGWNDAMNYIFRDGKGYRPYRRDEQYGE